MRTWIEKLAEKSKKEGAYKCLDNCIIDKVMVWAVTSFDSSLQLYINYLDENNNYKDSINLKIYPDEYDLLDLVIRQKKQELRLATIDFLNNL